MPALCIFSGHVHDGAGDSCRQPDLVASHSGLCMDSRPACLLMPMVVYDAETRRHVCFVRCPACCGAERIGALGDDLLTFFEVLTKPALSALVVLCCPAAARAGLAYRRAWRLPPSVCMPDALRHAPSIH